MNASETEATIPPSADPELEKKRRKDVLTKGKLVTAAANGDIELLEKYLCSTNVQLLCAKDDEGLFPGYLLPNFSGKFIF